MDNKEQEQLARAAESIGPGSGTHQAEAEWATYLMKNAPVVTLPDDAHQTMTRLINDPPEPTDALASLMKQ